MGRDEHGSDRPLSEEEVVERIEETGANEPVGDEPVAERRRHDEGDQTEQIRETAERAGGRGEDPEGHPVGED
jgi:hypothetical protein